MTGVLQGLRVVEMAGIGPAPFCGMLLADMGAEVVLVERPIAAQAGADPLAMGTKAIFNRGKRSLALDLKRPAAVRAVLALVARSDVLIEGMRPGVMERLGLGPETCLQRNPRLVYGRMTGWGQGGPLAHAAGHDINYLGLAGASWFSGAPGSPPLPPPTLVGDLGGGALYLALGVVAATLRARQDGRGQVVDAAIVDGSANLMNLLLSLHATGHMPWARGTGLLDGPYWYHAYRSADGHWISVGALEPAFCAELLGRLGVADDADFAAPYDPATWPRGRERLTALFASQPRAHWVALLEGTDACFAPVLTPEEAERHPHIAARGVYRRHHGVLQAAAAPRFSATPSREGAASPARGGDGAAILRELGFAADEIAELTGSAPGAPGVR